MLCHSPQCLFVHGQECIMKYLAPAAVCVTIRANQVIAFPCRHVVEKLEKQKGDDPVLAREELLQSKITSIIPCDITAQPMMPGAQGLFDVVACNNTLGPVSHSVQEYRENVSKLTAVVKPGGYLTILQSWDGSFYGVGEQSFHSLRITDEQFEEAVRGAGLSIVMNERKGAPAVIKDIPGNRKGMLFVAAQKSK